MGITFDRFPQCGGALRHRWELSMGDQAYFFLFSRVRIVMSVHHRLFLCADCSSTNERAHKKIALCSPAGLLDDRIFQSSDVYLMRARRKQMLFEAAGTSPAAGSDVRGVTKGLSRLEALRFVDRGYNIPITSLF